MKLERKTPVYQPLILTMESRTEENVVRMALHEYAESRREGCKEEQQLAKDMLRQIRESAQ